jgi:ceramide glucosyltransferase
MFPGYLFVMLHSIAVGLIALTMGFACLYTTLIIIHRPRRTTAASPLSRHPHVDVLLTLRNMDDGLEENLSSVFSCDYPDYSVLLAVDTLKDPCMTAVERVRARFPGVASTVIAAGHTRTSNPKIDKLSQLERHSDAELFWILDSDIRVAPGTLSALVHEHIVHDAGIVFCPIRGSGARTFGSILEMSYLDFFLSGSVLCAWNLLRQRVIVGKSLLIDRRAIEHFGGFSYFADVLAEDHWLGEAFARSGFSVRCNYTWVDNIKETSSVKIFFDRIARWAKLRYHLKRPVYLLEPLLNPLAVILLCLPFLNRAAVPFAGMAVVLRIALEYLVLLAVDEKGRKNISILCFLPAAVLFKDLLMLAVYVMPFFSSTITWRGGSLRIGRGTLIPLSPETRLLDGA